METLGTANMASRYTAGYMYLGNVYNIKRDFKDPRGDVGVVDGLRILLYIDDE